MDFKYIQSHKQRSFDFEENCACPCLIARYKGENVVKVVAPDSSSQYALAILSSIYGSVPHDEIYLMTDVVFLRSEDEESEEEFKERIKESNRESWDSMMVTIYIVGNEIIEVGMAPYSIDEDDNLVWDEENFSIEKHTTSSFISEVKKILSRSDVVVKDPTIQLACDVLNISEEKAYYIRMRSILEFLAEKECTIQDFYTPKHPEFKDILKFA